MEVHEIKQEKNKINRIVPLLEYSPLTIGKKPDILFLTRPGFYVRATFLAGVFSLFVIVPLYNILSGNCHCRAVIWTGRCFGLTDKPAVTAESSSASSWLDFQDDNLAESIFGMFGAKYQYMNNCSNIKMIKVQKDVRV